MQDYQKIGTAYLELLASNPFYNAINKIIDWYMDQLADLALKMYYWPFFVAGNLDDWVEIGRMYTRPMCFR